MLSVDYCYLLLFGWQWSGHRNLYTSDNTTNIKMSRLRGQVLTTVSSSSSSSCTVGDAETCKLLKILLSLKERALF